MVDPTPLRSPEPDPPEAAPPEPEPSCLEIRPVNGWAEVWLNGEPTGWRTNQKGCIEVPPGIHSVRLVHDLVDWREDLEITVSQGEHRRVPVELVYKPIRLTFPDGWEPDCRVAVDGAERGTLAEIGAELALERAPDLAHRVEVSCGAKGPRAVGTYDPGSPRVVSFPAPERP